MIAALTVVVGIICWLAGFEYCWHRYVAPLREKIQAEQRAQVECWTYEVVHEIAPTEPHLEVAVWLSTIEPHTGRVQSAALVPIHANSNPNARN